MRQCHRHWTGSILLGRIMEIPPVQRIPRFLFQNQNLNLKSRPNIWCTHTDGSGKRLWGRKVSQVPAKDKCGTCGGSWCQCLWLELPCWWKGAKKEMPNGSIVQIRSIFKFGDCTDAYSNLKIASNYCVSLWSEGSLLVDSQSWHHSTSCSSFLCILSYLGLSLKIHYSVCH